MTILGTIGPLGFSGGLFLLLLVALELGFVQGRHAVGEEDEKPAGRAVTLVKGAVLTLLGLLLGFSFAMSASRFESRKELIVKEANAIGTTYLRTRFLDDAVGSRMRQLLRDYTRVRIANHRSPIEEASYKESMMKGIHLQEELWSLLAPEMRSAQDSIAMALVAIPLNETIDLSATVTAYRFNKVPEEVLWLLLLTTVLSGMLVGHSFGLSKRRNIFICLVFSALLATVVHTIIDLDQPRRGFIHIEPVSLLDLQQTLEQDIRP